MHDPQCEKREYRALTHGSSHGRSTTTFVCPWCEAHVVAFVWSLCGGGKRCSCGAIFGGSGVGYRLAAQAAGLHDTTPAEHAKSVPAVPSLHNQGIAR